MKDCNECTVCSSVKDPAYYVRLFVVDDGCVEFYTFSNEGTLVEFLLSVEYTRVTILDIGCVVGHDFTYHWDV